MRNKSRKIYSMLFLLLFLWGVLWEAESVYAANWGSVELTAEEAVLMDADTGAVLFEKNAEEKGYPASITKVLTALVVLEHTSPDEQVSFSHDAVYNVDRGSSNAANEAANALAEHVAGSREAFAEMMNEKAKELGCTGSHFQNPSGLFSEEQYTTAKDMGLIAIAAFHNEEFMKIEKDLRYTLSGLQRLPEGNILYMEHKMMLPESRFYDSRVVAGKTGYTRDSGNTLLTLAKEGDRRLVTVVLKDKSPYHYSDTSAMLNLGFQETEKQSLEDAEGFLEKIRAELVEKGTLTEETKLHFSSKVMLTLPKGETQEGISYLLLEEEAEKKEISAAEAKASDSGMPDAKDSALPHIVFLLDGRKVGEANLYREQNIRVMLSEASPKTKAAFFAVTISGFTIMIAIAVFLFGGGALYGAKNFADERKRRKKWKDRRKKRLEEMKISEEEFRILLEKRKKEKKN